MPRRILVSLESRATYGYSRNVMRAMADFPALELTTLVTGMHLMPELGNSVDLIRADGFPVTATVPFAAPTSSRGSWARALGGAVTGFAEALETISPDILLLSGDRIETLGLCVTAAYMGLPVAHIQAGDKSGHIDDSARYAIGKLAHLHLASCADSADRLRRMGEQEFRIHDVGAPQLDDIVDRDFKCPTLGVGGRSLDLTRPYILLVQHPVLVDHADAGGQMRETLEACLRTGLNIVWIYPNADLGYQSILDLVKAHEDHPQVTTANNLDRDDYLILLANAAVLVGNSSSGILEAPSFQVPVVNIGSRQRGRPQASNILNCAATSAAIADAIDTALTDAAFQSACAQAVNPYGDGRSSPRICALLEKIPLDKSLLDKECTY